MTCEVAATRIRPRQSDPSMNPAFIFFASLFAFKRPRTSQWSNGAHTFFGFSFWTTIQVQPARSFPHGRIANDLVEAQVDSANHFIRWFLSYPFNDASSFLYHVPILHLQSNTVGHGWNIHGQYNLLLPDGCKLLFDNLVRLVTIFCCLLPLFPALDFHQTWQLHNHHIFPTCPSLAGHLLWRYWSPICAFEYSLKAGEAPRIANLLRHHPRPSRMWNTHITIVTSSSPSCAGALSPGASTVMLSLR